MIKTNYRLLPALLLLVASLATGTGSAADYSKERENFLQAEKAFDHGDNKRYGKLKASLKDYPLYPYLEFRELRKRLSRADDRRVGSFLKRHEKTPLSHRMRLIWLNRLAKTGKWNSYAKFYRPGIGKKYQCHYLNALLKTGHKAEALDQVEPLWLHGRSQPDACDPVFDAWREAKRLSEPLVWQRIELAMKASQTRLARYLGRFLPAKKRSSLQIWLQIHQNPKLIKNAKRLANADKQREKILLHGFKRLVRHDPDAAFQIWPRLQSDKRLTDDQRFQAASTLFLTLAKQEITDAFRQMDRLQVDEENHRFLEARIRVALSKREWNWALKWITALPQALAETERWRYWKGRTLKFSGRGEEADAVLSSLAEERSYHGFLAADQLELNYRFDNIPLIVNEEKLNQLAKQPGVQRTRELLLIDRMIDARREWRWVSRDMSIDELKLAAKLAQSWVWNDRAIFTLARTGYWDDLELRFPLQYRNRVDKSAEKQHLDNAWVFAVIRQESAFSSDAQSPAGALGLMQLMPRTARYIARKTNRPIPKRRELFDPETNITLGSAYLRKVYEQLGNHQVLATAAYNAGPHRVKSWLPVTPVYADVWIESIPFTETRRYVQRVLSYAAIYEHRMGRSSTRLMERMSQIHPEIGIAEVSTTPRSLSALGDRSEGKPF